VNLKLVIVAGWCALISGTAQVLAAPQPNAEMTQVLIELDPSGVLEPEGAGDGLESFKKVVNRRVLPHFAARLNAGVPTGLGAGLSYSFGPNRLWGVSIDHGVLPPFTSWSARMSVTVPKLRMFRLKLGYSQIGIGPVWRRVSAYEANRFINDWYSKYGVYDVNYAIPEDVFKLAVRGPTFGVEWKYKKLGIEVGVQYSNWEAAIARLYDQASEHIMTRTRTLFEAGVLNAEDLEATEIFLRERRHQLLGEELPKAFKKIPTGSRWMPYAEIRLELPFAIQ